MPLFKSLLAYLLLACGIISAHADVVPGVFGTGIAADGSLLAAGALDPHWQLVASADPASPGPVTHVVNNGFPIPPWAAQGPDSKWIAPKADQSSGNAAGAYRYRTSFDLTGFDPATVELRIVLRSDNTVPEVLLNGANTGLTFTNGFETASTQFLNSGFVAGVNTLEFLVNNEGGPTGLRCELLATATVVPEDFKSRAEVQGANVVLSWPAILPCYKLETSTSLEAQSWTPIPTTPVPANGRMTLTLPRDTVNRFYRLRRDEQTPPVPEVQINAAYYEWGIAESVRFGPEFTCDLGTGCQLQWPLDGTIDNVFDASGCIDPRRCLEGDPGLSYQWQFRFPPSIMGGAFYTNPAGITGQNGPVLTLKPSSLPALSGADIHWRVILTITSSAGGITKQTQALFRFQYDSSEMQLSALSPYLESDGSPGFRPK